jgi:hypothetical protein
MKSRFFIFCLITFFTTCISKSNQTQQGTIAAGALQKDLAVLKKTFEEVHPGFYWYSTQAAIDSLFDSAKGSIRDKNRFPFILLRPLLVFFLTNNTNYSEAEIKINFANAQ